MKILPPLDLSKTLSGLVKTMSYCMEQAQKEDPEGSKNWTEEDLFKKGAEWAGSHVVVTEVDGEDHFRDVT